MMPEPDGPETSSAHGGPQPEAGSSPDELAPDEEPTTTGTLFIMIFFLMALAGMWGIMYFTLLSR